MQSVRNRTCRIKIFSNYGTPMRVEIQFIIVELRFWRTLHSVMSAEIRLK